MPGYSSSQLFPMTKATSIRIICIYCLLINHRNVTAFVSLSRRHHQSSHNYGQRQRDIITFSPFYLSKVQSKVHTASSRREIALLARRGGSGGINKGGGKGKKKFESKKKHNKKSKKPSPSSSSPTTKAPKAKGNHAPPWQVMSTKDTQKNVQAEIKRRNDVRSGNLPSSSPSPANTKADISASSSLLTPTDRQLYNWKRFNPDKDITSLQLFNSYLGTRTPPPLGVPEVAFLGRSNVGKSSLLNRLAKRSGGSGAVGPIDTARVGKTPGATASVNLYTVRGRGGREVLGFADLPGFGYAKLAKEVKEEVEVAAERYLERRRELVLGILLVDLRRVPSREDRAVLAALYDLGVPLVVVGTKVDKIRKSGLREAVEGVRDGLGLPMGQPLCVSSVTGEGTKDIWKIILDACEEKVNEWRGDDDYEDDETDSDGDWDDAGTIQLDSRGDWIEAEGGEEELEYDQGYEWVHNFESDTYFDDDNDDYDSFDSDVGDESLSEDSKRRMQENELMQARANESNKLKNLRKKVQKMQKDGSI